MRRTSQEIADEVLSRIRLLEKEDARRAARNKKKVYSVIAVAACLVLIVGLSFAIPSIVMDSTAVEVEGMYTAAMLADAAAGSYILIGVIGFAAGSAVTIFCMKGLHRKPTEEQPHDRND